MFCNVPLSTLPLGARLGSSIYDERQTKLLAAGMEITEQLLATLTRRNVDSVVVSHLDLGRILAFKPQGKSRSIIGDRLVAKTKFENNISRMLDHELATFSLPNLVAARNPFADHLRPTEQRSYDGDLMNYLAERREIHVQRLHTLIEACGQGNAADLELTAEVARESLSDAKENIDAFTCIGANPYMLQYPSRHVTHTAMTAAA